MADILCVYISRTGNTKKLAERIGARLSAEVTEVTDGKDHSGTLGFIKAIFQTYSKKKTEILPIKTERPLSEYSHVIICFPIWCERACPIATSFLEDNKEKFGGKVSFAVTHDSGLPYTGVIQKLYKMLEKEPSGCISVQKEVSHCTENELSQLIEQFKLY